MTRAYVPSIYDEKYETFHQHPTLLPEVTDDSRTARQYNKASAEILLHARAIADHLPELGASPNVEAALRNAPEGVARREENQRKYDALLTTAEQKLQKSVL